MTASDHLCAELAYAARGGRPLAPGEPVPTCVCSSCTGLPAGPPEWSTRTDQAARRRIGRERFESLAEIARAVPILEIAQRLGIELRRASRGEFKATCPFHDEKTPSFYVVPAKGMYHCFGCGEHGDAISLLMRLRGLSFPEAVRELAGVLR